MHHNLFLTELNHLKVTESIQQLVDDCSHEKNMQMSNILEVGTNGVIDLEIRNCVKLTILISKRASLTV